MIACYLELYEEGEVKHINGPTHPHPRVQHWLAIKGRIYCSVYGIYGWSVRVRISPRVL